MEKNKITTPVNRLAIRDFIQSSIAIFIGAFFGTIWEYLEYAIMNDSNFDLNSLIKYGLIAGFAQLFRKFKQDEFGKFKLF